MWKNDDTDLYFDIGETVRFRIEAEEWVDQAPKGPKTDEEEDSSGKRPPYSLIVCFLPTLRKADLLNFSSLYL